MTIQKLVILSMLSLLTYEVKIQQVLAHPVTYQDGIALSIINQKQMSLWHTNYSFNARFAAGIEYTRFGSESPSRFGLGRVNVLLKRWLGEGRQGNIYMFGGLGSGQLSDERDLKTGQSQQYPLVAMIGAQADYETQTFYTAFIGRALIDHEHLDRPRYYHLLYRVGFAPYVSKVNHLQSWFVVQMTYMNEQERPSLVALMRFFHRTALWEIGADTEGHPWVHLMAHF